MNRIEKAREQRLALLGFWILLLTIGKVVSA